MSSEEISLSHKEILQPLLKKTGVVLSEYSFANLYLFRKIHDYKVLRDGQDIFISGRTYDGYRYLMPTADPGTWDLKKFVHFAGLIDFIFPVAEDWLGAFEGKRVAATFDEGDSDYVFTADKLSTYKGQKLHSKKNLLNQFMSLYSPEAQPLTLARMLDAREILDVWQQDVGFPPEATDYHACLEAFELYEDLVLCGGIYYVNHEPAGFIIGEELGPNMFALHFAKGKRKFKGMYQYMYNHFSRILAGKYHYLNFEQDLGKLALRIAKASYDPDQMLKKYRVKVL